MTLFSWYSAAHRNQRVHNNATECPKSNGMWPIAKVQTHQIAHMVKLTNSDVEPIDTINIKLSDYTYT